MRRSGFFVTGTDTNVGKTIASSLLVSSFSQAGYPVGYWKPVQTGSDSDRGTVLDLSGLDTEHAPPPRYEFPEPVAPAYAANLNRHPIRLEEIQSKWNELPVDRTWIVEGAGGLLVPLSQDETIADLIQALDLPVIVVASTRLGTMNHLLLTLEALWSRKLKPAAVLWMGAEAPGLEETLAPWLGEVPVIQRIPELPRIHREEIQGLAKRLHLAERLGPYVD